MAFAAKLAMADRAAETFSFHDARTMYGGKAIAVGDTVYLFASESAGGDGFIARGIVTAADHAGVAKPEGVARYTPRVKRTATATRRLGRAEIRPFIGKAGAKGELAYRLYKQATRSSGRARRWRGGVETTYRVPYRVDRQRELGRGYLAMQTARTDLSPSSETSPQSSSEVEQPHPLPADSSARWGRGGD